MADLISALSALGKSANAGARQTVEPESGDNKLRMPDSQKISDESISWTWELPDGSNLALVHRLSDESWEIYCAADAITASSFDDAKVVGDSLISAYEWRKVWKHFVADMLLKKHPDKEHKEI